MPTTNVTTYSTKQFRYSDATGVFQAEASALGLGVGDWPDGFYLRSARTGMAIYFSKPNAIHDQQEGDLVCVEYHGRTVMGVRRALVVRVLND